MIKKLIKFIGQYKMYALIAPILVIGETLSELLLPYLMGKIIDVGVANGDKQYIFMIGGLMILVAIIGMLTGVYSAKFSATASQGYGANLRQEMFAKIQTFSFADVDKFSTASLITRITNDVKTIQEMVMQVTRVLIRAPSMLIIAMFICLKQNALLSLVYIVAIPVLLAVVLTIMKFTHPLFKVMQEKFDGLNAAVQENLIAIRVVKSFVRMDYEKKKFKVANDDLTDTSVKAMMKVIIMNPGTTFVLNATTLAIYWFGGRMVGNGVMLSGQLVSFISYLNNIMMGVMMFSMILMQATRGQACANRILAVLEHEPDIADGKDDNAQVEDASGHLLETGRLKGEVEFKNVSFRYPGDTRDEDVLHDLNFKIEPGQFVAIVGSTGVGKTSMVNLIPRFYDATKGQVLVDGKDVREYSLDHLRDNIGIVLQTNLLFSGTIRENLQWGNYGATDEELMEAAKDCQAYEFISKFPEGLDTVIDQGGVNVSGGQKQRLCIGRAMLKNPSILILDDSTSAVDSATEARIRETFYTKYKNTTVLLIAQRISSVQYADKIIVLEDGTVSDIGTHDELMGRSPIYKAIYDSQQEGVGLSDG